VFAQELIVGFPDPQLTFLYKSLNSSLLYRPCMVLTYSIRLPKPSLHCCTHSAMAPFYRTYLYVLVDFEY